MTPNISDKQLLNKVRFIKWKGTCEAIHRYVNKRQDELDENIRRKKEKCSEIINLLGDFKARVGMELTLEEFERYVELHKELHNTMLDIKSSGSRKYEEVNSMLKDCMKLIDLRSPMYSKFMMAPKTEERYEKSSIFIMVFVALLFLSTIAVTGYLILEDDEWAAIVKPIRAYKILK